MTTEPLTPYERFKSSYTPLYRILLILGALAVLVSLGGITNIRVLFDTFTDDPFYAISGLISVFIVLPLMIASLILLAHKHPMGIRLRLTGYGISVAGTILGFFVAETTLQTIAQRALETAEQSGNPAGLTLELATTFTEFSFFGALYLAIFGNLLFAWLWWKAWKRQVKVDAKKTTDAITPV